MSPLANLLLAALGLPVVVGGVALVARHLVHRHGDTAAAAAYWAARNARHAEEVAALLRNQQRAAADRPKELTR